jgi:hypothetical protein
MIKRYKEYSQGYKYNKKRIKMIKNDRKVQKMDTVLKLA